MAGPSSPGRTCPRVTLPSSSSCCSALPHSTCRGKRRECYDIGRVVGDGNFAVVRECRRRDSGQTLAMKIVERSKLIGREHMMQNELSLLGSLCHPRIVRLFAHHHTHTHSYLVMELVSGGDLFEAISESGKFSEAAAGLMVSDVSEALSYIHSKSIVHRDLKPENLLVAAGVCRLKLGDFGLAMVVTEPVFTICGTPTYVAPEILCETGVLSLWFLSQIGTRRSSRGLIRALLQPDPTVRLAAEQTLQHPWVKAMASACRQRALTDRSLKNTGDVAAQPERLRLPAQTNSEESQESKTTADVGSKAGIPRKDLRLYDEKQNNVNRGREIDKQEQNIKEINTVQIRSPQIEESTPDQEKDFGSTEKCRTHNPGLKLSNADCADLNQAHQAQIHLSPLIETQPDPPLSPLAASSSARQHEQDLTSPLHNATTAPLQ
uniref:Doublecortin-like kinase 3 n=1 Tax=Salarias fasciatus TaxID=181472 RepID=A0A672HUS7_SALFA